MMRVFKKIGGFLLILLALAAIALAYFWYARPNDVSFDELKAGIPHNQSSKFAEVEGIKLHYQEKGGGPPVVLIHGYASSSYTWKDVFLPLAEKHRVIAVDLKGFGFSAKPEGDYTRREQARLVGALLGKLQIEKAWIVGNSMGGETALNIALQNPGRVAGLILLDSGGVNFDARSGLTPWYIRLPVIGPAITALALTSDGVVRAGLEKSFYDDAKVSPEKVSFYHQPLRTRDGQRATRLAREQFGEHLIEKRLGEIDKPTLIIWGEADEVIPLSSGRKMNSLIRNSVLKVYEKTGHLPQEENPERVLNDIMEFIEKKEAVNRK